MLYIVRDTTIETQYIVHAGLSCVTQTIIPTMKPLD